ncbi:MAG: family 16 glycosylhydrolase [Bacteroidota bacterium]
MNILRTLTISFTFSLTLFIPFAPATAQCYELVWAEEFNHDGLPDPAIWNFETGAGGWGNNELQYYKAEDTSNVCVKNGALVITAKRENYGGAAYTSGRITTRNKFEVQYGKIEASIRLPYGQGIWPAFWMLGENFPETGWPACGEIDIMEMVGGDPVGDRGDHTVHGTVHWDHNGSYASYGKSYALDSGIFADDFHLFGIEWTSKTIKWFVDGIQFNVIDITPSSLSEFRNRFFVILNIAVGGNWPGNPDATTLFPQKLEVDYIRVYRRGENLEIGGDTVVGEKSLNLQYTLPSSDSLAYLWSLPEDAEIVSGQATNEVTVNWGCTDGEVRCAVTGSCDTYHLALPVVVEHKISGPLFIEEGAGDQFFFVKEMGETSYLWSVPDDAVIQEGQGTDSIRVLWGSLFTVISLTTTNSCGSTSITHEVLKAGQYPYPDPCTPHPVPGVIDATEYDYGGEGIAYHDLSVANEGTGPRQEERVDTENKDNGQTNVGWILSGEWLEYSIEVESPGFYDLSLRVATDNASGGPFTILVNGEERMEPVSVSGTGGWDRFVTIRPGSLFLYESDTLLRMNFNTGGFNLGRMTFTYSSSGIVHGLQNTTPLLLCPNPAGNTLHIFPGNAQPGLHCTYRIVDLAGSVVLTGEFGQAEQAGQTGPARLAGEAERQIDIAGLSAGTYMVILTNAGESIQTARFIKLP